VFQIVNRFIDLLECIAASPTHQASVCLRGAIGRTAGSRDGAAASAARAGKIPAADEQTGVQDRWEAGRRDADEQSVASSIKPRKSYFCCYS
jgi:hypothetical protein